MAKSGLSDNALLYQSAKQKIRVMASTALSAAANSQQAGRLKEHEAGDLLDAETEFHSGIEQIISNLDIVAENEPLTAYNLAVGVIFSLRGYARFGGMFSVMRHPLRISRTNLKLNRCDLREMVL